MIRLIAFTVALATVLAGVAPAFAHSRKSGGPVAPPRMWSRPQAAVATSQVWTSATTVAPAAVDAKLLVISADGRESVLPAIRQALDYLGTPYTVWIGAERPGQLTPAQLANGTRGRYQGVILTTGNLAYSPDGVSFVSALSSAEWQALAEYQAAYRVRQVTWYTFPTPDFGFGAFTGAADTSVTPLPATLTAEGRAVFFYVNAQAPLTIQNAYTYLAPVGDARARSRPGRSGAALRRYPDGRENLALTFDGNPHLLHTLTTAYGIVNWVTRGLFLGERHAYLVAQADDVFIETDLYGGGSYRLTGDDLQALHAWQRRAQAQPATENLVVQLPFNGVGTTGIFRPDTLTPIAKSLRASFQWINHTYTHATMDGAAYDAASGEVEQNMRVARRLKLDDWKLGVWSPLNLITPNISGLTNPAAMQAIADAGVRFLVSDTSQPGQGNPSPNAGWYHPLQRGILMIPRSPTNLFYNVSTPTEWEAEYNALYRTFWGRDLTYEEILDRESDVLVRYLMKGDTNPWMFHQANLRAWDGERSLLGDLLDRTLDKYRQLVTVPVLSPRMDWLGMRMAERMRYNAAGVTATIRPGVSITITAQRAAIVPVTGLRTMTAEIHAGQYITWIPVRAGQTITLPLR